MATEVNPVKKYREIFGLSLGQVETAAGVHRQTIIRTEQGCYAQIPPRLYNFLLSRIGPGNSNLAADYSSWVDSQRRESFGRLNLTLPAFDESKHPFSQWREASELGLLQVCKFYCVHPSTLSRFENNLTMQSIPEQLRDALSASGYWTSVLDDLSIRYNLFRELALAKKSHDLDRTAKATANANAYRILHAGDVSEELVAGF